MQLNPIGAPQHLKQTGTLLLPVTPTVALGPAAYIPGLAAFTVGSLLYPNTTTTIAQLLAVAVNQVLVSGGIATAPRWSGAPTLTGITCTAINPLTTPAESWIGPSTTAGIYFNSGNVGIGTTSPLSKLDVVDGTNAQIHVSRAGADSGGYIESNAAGNLGMSGGGYYTGSAYLAKTTVFSSITYSDLVLGDMSFLQKTGLTAGNTFTPNRPMYIASNGDMGLSGNITATGFTGASVVIKSGNVGIGTTSPTNILSFGGNAARIFWMERHTTANNAGNTFSIQAGGATVAATDKAGGQLILLPGLSTGSAESGVTVRGCLAGGAGTGDNSLQDMIKVLGNKLGVFNTTPAVQQNHIADASGGATVDAEARAAINAALLVLETYGWLKAA